MNMPQNESEAVNVAMEIREKLRNMPNPRAPDIHVGQQLIDQLQKHLKKDQDLRKWCVEKAIEGNLLWEDIYAFVTGQTQKAIANLEVQAGQTHEPQ